MLTQVGEVGDEAFGVVAAVADLKHEHRLAAVGPVGQSARHGHACPGEPVGQHRRAATRGPGGPHRREEGEPGFVLEDDPGASPTGPLLILGQSRFTQASIAASSRSAARRAGRCRVQPNRWRRIVPGLRRRVPHPGELLDHPGDPVQGPHVRRIPVGTRTPQQRLLHQPQLRVRQPRRAPRPAGTGQRRPPTVAPRAIPPRCGLRRHTQLPGHIDLPSTPIEHPRCLHPTLP